MAIEYDQLGNAISGSYDGVPTPAAPSSVKPATPRQPKEPYTQMYLVKCHV
jgi:hypothetical protein